MTCALAAPVVDQAVTRILIACGLLAAAVVVLCAGVWYYRRRWLRDRQPSEPGGWSFADLRKMRDHGDLTEEEYQSLRAAMRAAYGLKTPPDQEPKGPAPAGGPTGQDGDFDLKKSPQA